ncbi:MAG TPA: class I SAM-dependent methyltransferase [Longimicrobium sp.]|nr:class I SAM-dependent methyltransferase [Longimicrobium sp.]
MNATVPALRQVERRIAAAGVPTFAVRMMDGSLRSFGEGPPAFTLVIRDKSAAAALASMDKLAVADAYVDGSLDVEGDFESAFEIRPTLSDRHPLHYAWRFLRPLLFGRTKADAAFIAEHYDNDAEFFLSFLDTRHRCYSQGVFEHDGEPLEDAITRKMEFALDAVGARPGDRVLDIGGGWGAMTEFGGRRGIRVTSLTISRASEEYIRALVDREGLPSRVIREHLMNHAPDEPYDAIVNLGVTEHLPDYAGTLKKYESLLKPGGRIYLDASATRRKHSHSTFLERRVFPGDGSLMCLHEYLAAAAATPFQLLAVHDDRHSYELTCRAWARNLDRARDKIEARFGSPLYRAFRIYLWGCADAFRRDLTQAYRVVLRLPERVVR